MIFGKNGLNKICRRTVCLGAGILSAGITGLLAVPAHAIQGQNPPLELVFVIDNSGSMRRTDPQFIMRQAVKNFVAQLSEESRVGLVLFDQDIHQLHQLHTLSNQMNKQKFINSLNKINYNGRYTNGPGGIEQALYDFKTNGHPESLKAIIFITDGIVTSSSKHKNRELIHWLKQDLLREIQQLGIRIYGVAFAETADLALIQSIASRTDGEYFRARDASRLSNALERIQALLSPAMNQPPALQPVPVSLKGNPNSLPAPIENGLNKEWSIGFIGKPWMLHLSLALITILLSTAAIVFFTKHKRIKPDPIFTPNAAAFIDLPQARLQDLDLVAPGNAASFDLNKAVTSIGRSTQNDLCLPQETISVRHAAIEYKYPDFYLTDLESTNGTGLNHDTLTGYESVRLKNGDTILFGSLRYKFEMQDFVIFNKTILLEGTICKHAEKDAIILIEHKEKPDQGGLMACLLNHLMQIEAIGPKYKRFVRNEFGKDTLNRVVAEGEKNMKNALSDHQLHCTPHVQKKIFYLICALPVEITAAAEWYSDKYGGFTQFVHQRVNDHPYQSAQCDAMCIVTFGKTSTHWVSITIVPTHSQPDPVEIISVDFLSSEEKTILGNNGNRNGAVS